MINTKRAHMEQGAAAWIAAAGVAVLSTLLLITPAGLKAAHASDIAPATSTGQAMGFFRVALNKTAIITLPAEAKEVVVGNNDIVDVVIRNKTTAYVFGRKSGSTNMFFFDANGQQIFARDVEVAVDPLALQNLIRRVLPGTHITVDLLGSNVVLGGVAMNALEAKTAIDLANEYIPQATVTTTTTSTTTTGGGLIVNNIRIAGEDQVMLQVKMVEMQRDVLKQWGVNFGAALNVGSFAVNLSNVNPFNSLPMALDQGYGVSGGSGGNSFTSILRAMESDGILHTLAEPNLTAVSGQAASFKAGGEFPYQTCQNGTCIVNFKDYGVGLDFTPTVLSSGRINLKIHTASTELTGNQHGETSDAGGGIPSLNVRAADTVLEIPDGGSMMLAGLIRENTRQVINGTPGLRDVPILGALFRSREFIANQTELVVLVTPHIVRSVAQQELETPDKNFNQSTEGQAFILGRMNKIYGSGAVPHGQYSGNVGYIVE